MVEEVELPSKQQNILTGINTRHLLIGLVLFVFLILAIEHGAFGVLTETTKDGIYIGAAILFYVFLQGKKPTGLIPFDRAILYAAQILLWQQRNFSEDVPQGRIGSETKWKLRTYNGKPLRYEILLKVKDTSTHLKIPILVKLDPYTADAYECSPKTAGWEPSDAPDYRTFAIPAGLFPQFTEGQE